MRSDRRITKLGILGVSILTVLLMSCGDDTPADFYWNGYIKGPNEGIGWLSIYEPYGEYPDGRAETYEALISMNGQTFIPPGASCPSLEGDFGSGYAVHWENAANGNSGNLSTFLNCFLIVQGSWSTENDYFDNMIPLELGENLITVISEDTYGNVGRGTVNVVRLVSQKE